MKIFNAQSWKYDNEDAAATIKYFWDDMKFAISQMPVLTDIIC